MAGARLPYGGAGPTGRTARGARNPVPPRGATCAHSEHPPLRDSPKGPAR